MRLRSNDSSGRSRLLGPVPLTPMVDVVFLLLIYFLLTTTQSVPESTLSPALQAVAESGSEPRDLEPQVVRVELGASGEAVFVVGSRSMSTRAELTLVLERLPKEGGVFVRADGGLPFGPLAEALQACTDAGFIGVTYLPGGER